MLTVFSKVWKDPKLIREMTLETVNEFSSQQVELVENCDLTSLSLTHLRYVAPWEIVLGKFRQGTVTVAGDAMHVMGPFIGQGGSAAIEDALVLARCLAPQMQGKMDMKGIEEGIDKYVKKRRMRLIKLSTQTYLLGSLLDTSSLFTKFLIILLMALFFRNQFGHNRFNVGRL